MRGEKLERAEEKNTQSEAKTAREVGRKVLAVDEDGAEQLVKKTEASSPREEVEYWAKEYNDTEMQFAQYSRGLPIDRAKNPEYRTTLEKYEEDIAFDWQRLEESTNKAMSSQLLHSPYEVADAQRLGVVEPHETVEAELGIFYDERAKALNDKVIAAEATEETAAEQQLLRQTWRKVMDYIEAATDYDFLHRDYSAYQDMRRFCHNNMIQQLNALNQLAEKYDCKRFTPRDFMTNDFKYDKRRDRTGRLNQRANYDRETVLGYFRTVFDKDFRSADRKAQRLSQELGPGMMYYD